MHDSHHQETTPRTARQATLLGGPGDQRAVDDLVEHYDVARPVAESIVDGVQGLPWWKSHPIVHMRGMPEHPHRALEWLQEHGYIARSPRGLDGPAPRCAQCKRIQLQGMRPCVVETLPGVPRLLCKACADLRRRT